MSPSSTAEFRAHATVFKPAQQTLPSTIYTLLPSAFRSRIPVFRSIRQSAGFSRPVPALQKSDSPMFEHVATNNRNSFSSTSTFIPSGSSTPVRPGTPETNDVLALEMGSAQPRNGVSCSGVQWDMAAAGVRLWISARTQVEQQGDSLALRSMHIDALRYMHMALPADLLPVEVEILRSSIAPQVLHQPRKDEVAQERVRPNALRQSVAQMVCWIAATLLFLLPLLMTLLNRALQYEREHQITERVITNGVDLTNTLGERGMDLQNALVRFRDGRVGGVFFDTASWVLESVVGGVNDGLSQKHRE